jgi:hypothetical protein
MPNRSSYRFLNDFKIQSKINENYNRIERDYSELLVSKTIIKKINDKLARKVGTPLTKKDDVENETEAPRPYFEQFVEKQHEYYKIIDDKKNKTLEHIVKNEATYLKDKYKRSIKYNPYVDVYKDEYLNFDQKELLAQMRISMLTTPKSILKPSIRASSYKSNTSFSGYVDRHNDKKTKELPNIENKFLINDKKLNKQRPLSDFNSESKAILPKIESAKRAQSNDSQNVINEANFLDKVNLFQSELIRLKMESMMSNADTKENTDLSIDESYMELNKVDARKSSKKKKENLLKKIIR